MPTPTPIKYPLDLTGRSPDNLVVGEPHSIGVTGNRAIVLNHGPFFTRGLVVRKASDGTILTPRVHYKAAQLFPEATIKTGQEICSIIVIDDVSVGSDFLIDYQLLGGDYSASINAIQQLIDTLDLDERPVRWGAILGKPQYFPPTPHLHDLGDLYGFEYVVAAIEGVRQAILLGDVFRDQEIYDYIDLQDAVLRAQITNAQTDINQHIADLNNPHQTTKGQVGLGNVENLPVATDIQAKTGTSNVTYMTPLRTKAAIDLHATRMDNPHGVTKAQIGLSLVSNFAVCTLLEALAGTSQSTYTTPFHVKAMIQKALDEQVPPEPPYVAPSPRYTTSGSTNVEYNQTHSIRFDDQTTAGSRTITSKVYNWGDGSPTHTLVGMTPVAHQYLNAGTYVTTLTVTDDQANVRTYSITLVLTKNAAPAVPPTVDFTWTGNQTVIDPNNPIIDFAPAVTAGSAAITGYKWEFDVALGAGSPVSLVADPGPTTYTMAVGSVSKTVRLTVTDANGLSTSKTVNIPLTKSASNVPPTANFSYTGATTVTSPASHNIDFASTSSNGTGIINAWLWTFGDGTTSTAADPPAKAYAVAVGSQNFTVSLKVTDTNGLTNTKTITLPLTKLAAPINPPIANFNTDGVLTVVEGNNHSIGVTDTSTNGSGTITSWLWNWGDGTPNNSGKSPGRHMYTVAPGTSVTRTITLTVTDSNNQTDTFTRDVTLVKTNANPPTSAFNATGAMTVAEPSNHVINFADASTQGTAAINAWLWNFGDGTTSTAQNPGAKTYAGLPFGTTNVTVKLKVTDTLGRWNESTQVLALVKTPFTLPALTNLDFDSGDVSWTKNPSTVINTAGAAAHTGTWRARIVNPAANGAYADMSGAVVAQGGAPVTPNQYVTASCRIRPSAGSSGKSDNVVGTIRILWLDYWGNHIGTSAGGTNVQLAFTPNAWTNATVNAYAPEGAKYYTLQGDGFVRWGSAYLEFDTFTHSITTPPVGPPGGGGECVAIHMYLDADRKAGDIMAGDIIDGANYETLNIEDQLVGYNAISVQPTYRMVTRSGIALIASDTTPFTLRDGSYKWMGDMLGEEVLVDDDGVFRWESVDILIPSGMREVAKISIDNHSYFAGEEPTRRIASHNQIKQ